MFKRYVGVWVLLITIITSFIYGTHKIYADSQLGVGTQFNRCVVWSGGGYDMSYDECVSLAWLYTELNGDSWGTSGRWFLYADPEEWYGYNGVNGNQTGVIDMEGGQIRGINLLNNNLSGSITSGLLYLPYLRNLGLQNNSLSSVNLSALTGVLTVELAGNNLSSLDVTNNRSLTYLGLDTNHFTGIDISQNTGLVALAIGNNNFSGHLSFSGYNALRSLYMANNGLTYFDLFYNTGLTLLYASNNPLTGFNINTYTAYPNNLVTYFNNTTLDVYSLGLNKLRFLHNTDASRGRQGFGGSVVTKTPIDNCPNGDMSPTQYDGLCAGMSLLNGGVSVLSTTGNTMTTGIVATTGISHVVGVNTTNSAENTINGVASSDIPPINETMSMRISVDTCPDTQQQSAYLFARQNGVTTMDTCKKARIDNSLTRGEAAKMIANFARNILNQLPDTSITCSFPDMADKDSEMQEYAIAACQLGIMGLKGDGTPSDTFNPDGIIDKAQFATMLSRMIYGTENNDDSCRYCKHVDALKSAGAITVTTDLAIPLRRGWAMLMLQRVSQK